MSSVPTTVTIPSSTAGPMCKLNCQSDNEVVSSTVTMTQKIQQDDKISARMRAGEGVHHRQNQIETKKGSNRRWLQYPMLMRVEMGGDG